MEKMIVTGSRHDRIAQIAGVQRGRISCRQLRDAGLTRGEIATLAGNGQLRRQLHGIYAVGHEAAIPLAAETEALLACGAGTVLSHGTAGVLWGLTPPLARESPVSVIAPASRKRPQIDVHYSRALLPRDVRIREGLPVTSPARTLLDLAGVLTPRRVELAFDHALIHRLMRANDMRELLQRTHGRLGQALLRDLLGREQGPGVTRSEAEERFLALVREAQLPEPEVNVRLHGWEVDFLWREARLVVEIDGYRYHSAHTNFVRDRRKDAVLHEHGLTVLRLTWLQLEGEPFAVVARLSRWLAGAFGAQAA